MKISPISDRVAKLLTSHPHLRDDDYKLVANIWHQEAHHIGTADILKLYASQRLTCADTITRARRKLQEENVHLRGKLWAARHKEEEVVKEDLRTHDWSV